MSNYIFIALIVIAAVLLIRRSGTQRQLAVSNREAGKSFLESNAKNPRVEQTASGLQYEVMVQGEGTAQPTASDQVRVHYHGTLIDGTVFDSSVNRGQPISFGLKQVIPGWTEGVQLMTEGSKFRFFIPPDLGYGDRAAGSIPPGSVLVFEVELLTINP